MARKGRTRKSGPRHPSGKLQQTGIDPIAPTLLVRIVTEAKKHGLDPRLGTQLGQLFMRHEITAPQAAAGFKMARIYQDFERFKGKRRSPASPNYGGGGDHSIAEELLNAESLTDLEDRIKDAAAKFRSLDAWCEINLSRIMRARLQELCVEDKYIGLITEDVRNTLDRMGLFFGFTSAKHALADKKPAISSTPMLKTDVRKPNLDRIYWMEVARRLRPDLSDDDLNHAYDTQRTLVERAKFQNSKPARTDNVIEISTKRKIACPFNSKLTLAGTEH